MLLSEPLAIANSGKDTLVEGLHPATSPEKAGPLALASLSAAPPSLACESGMAIEHGLLVLLLLLIPERGVNNPIIIFWSCPRRLANTKPLWTINSVDISDLAF
jgi:hypothetical protein